MEINAATTIANNEIKNNKAQTGLDILTRTTEKAEEIKQTAQEKEKANENVRAEIAQETGKGQNIDVKA